MVYSGCKKTRYWPLNFSDIEDDDDSLQNHMDEHDQDLLLSTKFCKRSFSSSTCLTYSNLLLFCFSITLSLISFADVANISRQEKQGDTALKSTSFFSPVLETLDISIADRIVVATLASSDSLSVYQQDPSPEVDMAWHSLAPLDIIPISAEDVRRLGKDPNYAVKLPKELGHGREAYAGRLDIFHQIHCLDALRREAHFEHYYGDRYPGGLNTTGLKHKRHLSHCVHYLLQKILCAGSADVYTHFWAEDIPGPFPDFSINQKCRDVDAIRRWHDERKIPVADFEGLKKPTGALAKSMNRDFKDIFGFFERHEDDGSTGGIAA